MAYQSSRILDPSLLVPATQHPTLIKKTNPPSTPDQLQGVCLYFPPSFSSSHLPDGVCRAASAIRRHGEGLIQVILEVAVTEDRQTLRRRVRDECDLWTGERERMYRILDLPVET